MDRAGCFWWFDLWFSSGADFCPWHENGTVQDYSNIKWEGGSLFYVRQVVGVTAVVRG